MIGEELNAAEITARGLAGDRSYALVDASDGKVATAKNPRRWPNLFDFRAVLVESAPGSAAGPTVRITLPGGDVIDSAQNDVHRILSEAVKREVTLQPAAGAQNGPQRAPATAEEYWPDIDGLDYRDTVTDFAIPEGTFFDCAQVHLLTTGTLERLRDLYPRGRFEARRFRPNIIVRTADDAREFVENAWIGRSLAIGDRVRLRIDGPCPRCVMTTLAQGDLPADPGILKTAAQHNSARVGVYASVLQGGRIRRGDPVRVE